MTRFRFLRFTRTGNAVVERIDGVLYNPLDAAVATYSTSTGKVWVEAKELFDSPLEAVAGARVALQRKVEACRREEELARKGVELLNAALKDAAHHLRVERTNKFRVRGSP